MKEYRKYLIFVVGLFVFGFGISMGNNSLLGSNPMGVFVVGLSKHLPLSVGNCNMLVSIILCGIGFICDRKNVTLATLIGIFVVSWSLDLSNMIIPAADSIVIKIFYMFAGFFFYCLGLALQQHAGCGLGHLDCCIFGVGKVLNIKEYPKIRWIIDGMFIVFGYLLGGIVGIGTVMYVLAAGLAIVRIKKEVVKILK